MRHLFHAASCLALLALTGCEGMHQGCTLALATEIPLKHLDHEFVMPVLLNGKDANFIFDTGSAATLVTYAAAARLKLRRIQSSDALAEGIGGQQTADILTTNVFQIGRLKGNNLKLFVSNVGPSDKEDWIDGVMGDNFLAAYDVDFNPKLLKATLYTASGDCAGPTVAMGGALYTVPLAPRLDGSDPRPVVTVTIRGQKFRAMIDTGADSTAIFRSAARRLGLTRLALAKDKEGHVWGVGPRQVMSHVHVFEPITIGDLTLTHAPVTVINQDMQDGTEILLGEDFITRVHLWLSFSSRTLVIQYPPS